MLYKTIILELIHQNRPLRDRLRKAGTILETLDFYASELKTSHEDWQVQLAQRKPASAPSQISSEAFEFALKDLESHLRSLGHEAEPASLGPETVNPRSPTPTA